MALYKYGGALVHSESAEFDNDYRPGTPAPHSGVYRCTGCGVEVASNRHQPLPPQNHHQHSPAQGLIRWRLIVYAVQESAA